MDAQLARGAIAQLLSRTAERGKLLQSAREMDPGFREHGGTILPWYAWFLAGAGYPLAGTARDTLQTLLALGWELKAASAFPDPGDIFFAGENGNVVECGLVVKAPRTAPGMFVALDAGSESIYRRLRVGEERNGFRFPPVLLFTGLACRTCAEAREAREG